MKINGYEVNKIYVNNVEVNNAYMGGVKCFPATSWKKYDYGYRWYKLVPEQSGTSMTNTTRRGLKVHHSLIDYTVVSKARPNFDFSSVGSYEDLPTSVGGFNEYYCSSNLNGIMLGDSKETLENPPAVCEVTGISYPYYPLKNVYKYTANTFVYGTDNIPVKLNNESLGTVSDYDPNAHPVNGYQDGYWYVRNNQTWQKYQNDNGYIGAYIEDVTANDWEAYPAYGVQDGYFYVCKELLFTNGYALKHNQDNNKEIYNGWSIARFRNIGLDISGYAGQVSINIGATLDNYNCLLEYNQKGVYKSFWNANENPRTFTLDYPNEAYYLDAMFNTSNLDNCYLSVDGHYLYRGKNV